MIYFVVFVESPTEKQIDCLIDDARTSNWRRWGACDIVGTLCSLICHLG